MLHRETVSLKIKIKVKTKQLKQKTRKKLSVGAKFLRVKKINGLAAIQTRNLWDFGINPLLKQHIVQRYTHTAHRHIIVIQSSVSSNLISLKKQFI